MKQDNYEKYWRSWSVSQTPKIDFNILKEDGWNVYDVNINNISTEASKDDVRIRADYSQTGGVTRLCVKKDDKVVYEQYFNFLLKPKVEEIKKVLESATIKDWKKYLSLC